jgi:predicted Holliday junction resolvase-like endonuclease
MEETEQLVVVWYSIVSSIICFVIFVMLLNKQDEIKKVKKELDNQEHNVRRLTLRVQELNQQLQGKDEKPVKRRSPR